MGDLRYQRVSRKRPCLICGKPDWCSRTADDSISFCAPVREGADRLSSKEQWGVFYHDRELLTEPLRNYVTPRNFHKLQTEEIPPAPLEIRDYVYKSLLKLSPASDHECLTVGAKGLRERGLENFEDYGALPCTASGRKNLAAQLRLLLNHNFPSFIREKPQGIALISGFSISESGEVCLWLEKDYIHPLLVVPYRNPFGKIQACQLRFAGSLGRRAKRYMWLSLPANKSAGSGTPLHYANWKTFGTDSISRPVLITEGALKSDVVAKFRPQFLTVAIGGVSCAHDLLVKITRGKKVCLAFDSDYQDNPAVLRQLAKLISLLNTSEHFQSFPQNIKILAWEPRFKGLDDARFNKTAIVEFSLSDW